MPDRQNPDVEHAGDFCVACKATGRIFVATSSGGIKTWTPTPCPECRPEASLLTADRKVKDEAGRKAARAAQQRGA